jgi:hypothetical protein
MSKNIHATQDWVRDNLSIKPIVSGELISLPDSTEAPLQSMKIFGKTTQFTTTGKNKLNVRLWKTEGTNFGVTVKYLPDEDCFLLNGTMTADGSVGMRGFTLPVEIGKSYTLLCEVVSGSVTGDNVGVFFLGCTDDLSAGTFENWQTVTIKNSYSKTVTPPKQYVNRAWFYCYSGATFINYKIRLMFSEGTDTTYEPYTGGIPSPNPNYPQELVSVGDSGSTTEYVMGKNLLPYPYSETTKTMSGITFTDNGDGSITINGTAAEGTYPSFIFCRKNIRLVDGETYYMPRISNVFFYCAFRDENGKTRYGESEIVWSSKYKLIQFYLQISGGTTVSNITFYPIIARKNSYDGIWEPYKKEQSLTISTPNGLPGLNISLYKNQFDYAPSYIVENNAFICNEINCTSLVHRKPIRTIVYTGNENWKKASTTITNQYGISLPAISGYGKTSHFKSLNNATSFNNGEDGAYSIYTASLYINTSQFATLEEFKAFLKSQYEAGTPLTFVYAVQAEKDIIETPLTEEEIQAYKALHTNYPNTIIYNDEGAYTEVEYVADTKLYVDNKFAELQANILKATE